MKIQEKTHVKWLWKWQTSKDEKTEYDSAYGPTWKTITWKPWNGAGISYDVLRLVPCQPLHHPTAMAWWKPWYLEIDSHVHLYSHSRQTCMATHSGIIIRLNCTRNFLTSNYTVLWKRHQISCQLEVLIYYLITTTLENSYWLMTSGTGNPPQNTCRVGKDNR